MAACTFGSWTIWVVALFQAVLSSICRFTQVVMIETSARTVARTTSVQITIRRLRLSGATAFAVGAATASLSRRAAWAASSHPGEYVATRNDPNGFDGRAPGDDIFQ